MDFNFNSKKFQFLLVVICFIFLRSKADNYRFWVGEEASSQSRKFTRMSCFDMGSGSITCVVKKGVQLYFYSFHSIHVEIARRKALETALANAVTWEMSTREAAIYARQEGVVAAKLAKQQVQRIVGPFVSSEWDYFEARYYGGSVLEAFLTGSGTLFGAYGGGMIGEQWLGWFGYLTGGYLGSLVGGRIGLMAYDIVNEVHFLPNFVRGEEESGVHENAAYVENEAPYSNSDDSLVDEAPIYTTNDFLATKLLYYTSFEGFEESYNSGTSRSDILVDYQNSEFR